MAERHSESEPSPSEVTGDPGRETGLRSMVEAKEADNMENTSSENRAEERAKTDTMAGVMAQIRGARDAINVGRAFGDAYELDGVTIIPVARVGGGAGGGGGEGTKPAQPTGTEGDQADEDLLADGEAAASADQEQGSGFGSGFGVAVVPVGVYEVRDGKVSWNPAVDVNRIVRGGQFLAALVTVSVSAILWRRQR